MCACCQKKSFFIKDILKDIAVNNTINKSFEYDTLTRRTNSTSTIQTNIFPKEKSCDDRAKRAIQINEMLPDVQKEKPNNVKVNVEHRRNTYPMHPTALRLNSAWPAAYSGKDFVSYPASVDSHMFTYFSEPILNQSSILRNQLVADRYMPHALTLRPGPGYTLDRLRGGWCRPWWGASARRKGGQVRFSAAQTGALERRFGASKYLSPDERKALASTLSLSDRQVKTWFQNRRAKWRRTTSDSADAGSPTLPDGSESDALADDD